MAVATMSTASTALGGAIAAGEVLKNNKLTGTIRFYGDPAEENYSGKMIMVIHGLFDDVDAALSHHPGDLNVATLASSNVISGCRFAFHGKSSHAAETQSRDAAHWTRWS